MLIQKTTKAVAMAAGLVTALAAATLAQNPARPAAGQPGAPTGETLSVGDATIDWLEKSDVAALREGVIDRMEMQVGDEVPKNGTIGTLHSEIAALTVAKAKVAATNTGAIEEAEAKKDLAANVLARSLRLRERVKDGVSQEEVQKNQAELKVASAMVHEAKENQHLAEAEMNLAERALLEHTITAPFTGVITERMKNPGESVRANEPVVRLGNINKLRVAAWFPIEYAFRVHKGDRVVVQPNIPNAVLGIEQLKFTGKVTFVDPEAEPTKTEVRVFAEVENNEAHDLKPGLKADMIIYLNSSQQQQQPKTQPADAQTSNPAAPRVGVRSTPKTR